MVLPKSSALLSFLLLPVFLPFAAPLYFDFPSFNESTSTSLIFDGDANSGNQVIHLTKNLGSTNANKWSTGSVVHPQPLLVWDTDTRNVTDFTTHFSFRISTATDNTSNAEGFAFFLAPYPYSLPPNSSGGCLGLFDYYKTAFQPSKNRLVAVEFDTYLNPWDPSPYHIGIDVNSLNSTAHLNCNSGIAHGRVSNATIAYSSSTRSLSVSLLTYNADVDGNYIRSFSHVVDLSEILPQKVAVGFSGSTGDLTELHQILSWDFSSTIANDTRSSVDEKNNGNIQLLTVVPPVVVAVMIAGGILWFILWHKKAKKHRKHEENESMDIDEMENGRGPRKLSFNELASATNNFAEEGKLGEGGFGNVYKGLLNGEEVAIKRVSADSNQGKKEYLAEVRIISQLRHRNLVQLVGWCHENGEFLLAYKYMSNGSLDRYLYNKNYFLSWAMRYKIANNLASSLLYLHEEWEQCVVHRDIKPSNVMLDSSFNAKLGDFGLARLVDHELDAKTTVLAGTPGYMAPENDASRARATKESDVYSFGVVALQLASGRKANDLVEWVRELYGEGVILNAADERLRMDFDEKEMLCLLVVGLWCTQPYPRQRPSIRQALAVLNLEAPLPDLPREMPIPAAVKSESRSRRALVEGSVRAANTCSTVSASSSSSASMSAG